MRPDVNWWTDDKIEFYERASMYSSFHRKLASIIEEHISKSDTILELGAGMAHVTSLLHYDGYDIKAYDNCANAVNFVNRREKIKLLTLSDACSLKEKADVVLIYGNGIADALHRNGDSEIQITADAANPNAAASEALYLTQILQSELASNNRGAEMPETSAANIRMLYNPQMKSAYNFVPGVMGLLLILICALMTSVSIVREKETGTMETLLVSPVKPVYIIFSKMVPYFTISCFNYITILALAYFVLDVPMAGSIFWLTAASLIYITLALALGETRKAPEAKKPLDSLLIG